MSRTHGNSRFKHYGTEVTKLHGSRYRIEVRCDVTAKDRDWYYSNRDNFFKDFGDLYSLPIEVSSADTGWSPDLGEEYPDMCLVSTDFGYIPNREDPLLTFTYETLTSTFVSEAADKVDYEMSNLRRVTRSVIAKDGSTYGKTVGTSTISHDEHGYGTQTLYLASAVEYDKKANEGGFVRIIETWLQSGVLSKDERQGPAEIPNSKVHIWEAIGDEPTLPGIVIGKSRSNVEGYITYRYTSISTLADGDPTAGTLASYSETVDVKLPGEVGMSTFVVDGGNTAYLTLKPPTIGQKLAQVDITITTSATADTPVAYNLSEIYTAVYEINYSKIPTRVRSSGLAALYQQRVTVNQTPLPYYVRSASQFPSDPSSINATTTQASLESSDFPLTFFDSSITKTINLTGSVDTDVTTTGVYRSSAVPIFQDLDGVQYYRKTTYTLS